MLSDKNLTLHPFWITANTDLNLIHNFLQNDDKAFNLLHLSKISHNTTNTETLILKLI